MKEKKENKNTNLVASNMLKNYFKFYNDNIKRKHAIIYIISMIIFFILLSFFISNIDVTQNLNNISQDAANQEKINIVKIIFEQKIPLMFLIIFAGITPYVYIPVLGMLNSYTLATSIINIFGKTNNNLNLIFSSLGSIIQLFGTALAIATGIYYCTLATKRSKYNKITQLGVNDIKRNIYQLTKNEKKLNELEQKIENQKIEKEKLNVKIPYINLIISGIISSIIVIIGTIISGI